MFLQTSSALAGILLCLAKNPEKQSILREHISAIKEPLTTESLGFVPYLRACVKESLRFYPVTFANGRALAYDTVIDGYNVPAKTMAMMVFQPLTRDAQYFKNPNQFIPERWVRESDEYQGRANVFAFLPFGAGARSCVGQRFSNMELELATLNIVKNFVVEYDYSTENPFVSRLMNVPNIPLKFKFKEVSDS